MHITEQQRLTSLILQHSVFGMMNGRNCKKQLNSFRANVFKKRDRFADRISYFTWSKEPFAEKLIWNFMTVGHKFIFRQKFINKRTSVRNHHPIGGLKKEVAFFYI